MTQPFRTEAGGQIDRSRPVRFSFDGRAYVGYAGDTLASALLANGVHLMGRSYKYHRPRGVLSAGAEEPNALVNVARDAARSAPNLRATQVELYEGLTATSQNRFPSLGFDLGAINDVCAPLLGAGFYYKTFMAPRGAWFKLYEPIIRHAAGLGRAPVAPDPDRYANRYAHCDLLIAGGGPAGVQAALEAAPSGQRIIIADDNPGFDSATLAGFANVTCLPRTTVFGYFPHNFLGLAERLTDHLADPGDRARERLWQVRAKQVSLATGAIERPLVFAGNDRPGIMLAGAARTYLDRYGVLVGKRVVVFTACDTAYAAAVALHRAGSQVVAILDLRDSPGGPEVAAVREAGIAVYPASSIVGTQGRLRVRSVTTGAGLRIACDAVLMSGGWTPSVHLYSQARGKLVYDEERQFFRPAGPLPGLRCVGACNGDLPESGGFLGVVPGQRGGPAFVDFQNDVKASDIQGAVAEGFRSIEHVKRYTTTGMATDQGKTSNMDALAIAAQQLGQPLPSVGLTTFRMPYTPVTLGLFAGAARGELFDPVRQAPLHDWAQAAGAVFEDVGLWKRARAFPRGGEDLHAAVARECRTVREAAGLFDASTLGKVEVVGPDAAEFLNRLYTNSWSKLAVGRCRYGLMLTEAGFVMDDGVVARLTVDRFHVTTTTTGAPRVLAQMEDYLQTEFPELKVWLTSTTEQWAVIAVQGPRARAILAPHVSDIDLAMPHMSVREGRVAGVPARLFRVSFTGELGFEVNVPAGQAQRVWDVLWAEAAKHGACAYGTEAMHVLRAEKGYIIVGQDTDGTVTPDDLGLGWAIGRSKPDFVGKRSLLREDLIKADRPQFVGLLTVDPVRVPEEGAQIVPVAAPAVGSHALGHVTSAYSSATLNRSIALGLVEGGRGRMGEVVHLTTASGTIPAVIAEPVFYDREGGRLDG